MLNEPRKTRGGKGEDSMERYNSFNIDSHDPVFVINRKGELIDVNEAFCEELGVSRGEILGINIGEASFLTDESRKKAMYRHVSKLIGKETPAYNLEAVTTRGDTITLDIDTKNYMEDGKVAGEIGIVKRIIKKGHDREIKERENIRKIPRTHERENVEFLDEFEKIREKAFIKIRERDEEIRRLKSELDEKLNDLDTLKDEINRTNKEWKINQSEAEEKNYEVQQLQDEIEKMKQRLETQNRDIDRLRNEVLANQSKLEEKNRENRQIKMDFNKKQKELEEKNEEIKQLQTEIKEPKIRDINTELACEEIEKIKGELACNQSDLQEKIQELEMMKAEMENKQLEIESLDGELKTRNKIIEELAKQMMDTKPTPVQQSEEILKIRNELEKRNEELRLINLTLEEKNKETEITKGELKNAVKYLKVRNEELTEIEDQVQLMQT